MKEYKERSRGMSSQTTKKTIQQKSVKPSCVLNQSMLKHLFIDIF